MVLGGGIKKGFGAFIKERAGISMTFQDAQGGERVGRQLCIKRTNGSAYGGEADTLQSFSFHAPPQLLEIGYVPFM